MSKPQVQDARSNKRGYDEKVDLWSLGALYYLRQEGPNGGFLHGGLLIRHFLWNFQEHFNSVVSNSLNSA